MRTLNLKIDGMSCGHCVGRVTSALRAVPGVEVAGVRVGSAEVRLDPAVTSAQAVAAAVTAAGYHAAAEGPAGPPDAAATAKAYGSGCGTK